MSRWSRGWLPVHGEGGDAAGSAKDGTKAAGRGANFQCVLSDTPMVATTSRPRAMAGRMGARLMALLPRACAGVFISPRPKSTKPCRQAEPSWKPSGDDAGPTHRWHLLYGLKEWGDLFTPANWWR